MLTISTMIVRLFVIFVVLHESLAEKRGTSCLTPNFENVTCVPLRTCKVIIDALQTQNSSAREFAKQSQCGYDTEPLVCCGSSGYPLGIPDLFTMAPEMEKKVTKQETKAIILSNFGTKALPDRTVCGLDDKKANRITGGTQTELGEFPWMAALEYKLSGTNQSAGIKCGGSLINNRYVLTAAHCIQHHEFELSKVWLGEWKISTNPDCEGLIANTDCADKVQIINATLKIPHPYYNKRSGNHDIGLIRLEHDVKYTSYIRPICLPPSNLPIPAVRTNLTVVGWGATENGPSSDIQLKVAVPILPNDNCNKLTGAKVSKNQLCAGGEQGKDSCQGDSGGPLMRTYEDIVSPDAQWYQEGIVALGVGCGRAGRPAIYTRVSRYIIWIIDHIQED